MEFGLCAATGPGGGLSHEATLKAVDRADQAWADALSVPLLR